MRNIKKISILIVIIFLLALTVTGKTQAKASVKVSVSDKSICIGEHAKITSNSDNAGFKCSNTEIAYISENGVITGKKAGKVKVWAYTDNGESKKIQLEVKGKKYKPSQMSVCTDEINIVNSHIEVQEDGKVIYSSRIKNNSKSGKANKVIVTFEINCSSDKQADNTVLANDVSSQSLQVSGTDETKAYTKKEVSIIAENIKPGEVSSVIKCEGDISGNVDNMVIKRIQVYSDNALYTYESEKDKYVLDWGTKDKTAPVLKGFLKKNSYNNEDVYRVYYSDKKDEYTFKEYVSAHDDRSKKVKIKADTSDINWKKTGVYKIYYKATDEAGNTSKSWAKVQVIVTGAPERFADQLLNSCIKKNWSDDKKIRAIYSFVKAHHSYVDRGSRAHWRKVGVSGFYAQAGDCYSYYSICRLMITRAGIPNIMIRRQPAPPGHNHWWNLVYIKGGWYHFDTCPRKGRYLCLQTSEQLHRVFPGYEYRFPSSAYPTLATKRISRNP